MSITRNNASSRMGERLFVLWEEAGGDPDAAYQLWHKVRPLLADRGGAVLRNSRNGPAAAPAAPFLQDVNRQDRRR